MKLSLRRRKLARVFARECFLATKDEDKRREMFEERCKPYRLDPATIAALIMYAIKLWMWWRTKRVNDPGESAMRGEPRE